MQILLWLYGKNQTHKLIKLIYNLTCMMPICEKSMWRKTQSNFRVLIFQLKTIAVIKDVYVYALKNFHYNFLSFTVFNLPLSSGQLFVILTHLVYTTLKNVLIVSLKKHCLCLTSVIQMHVPHANGKFNS